MKSVQFLPSFRTLGHQRTVAPISCDRVLTHDWTPWWRLMECRCRSAWTRSDVDDPTVSFIQLAGAFRIGGRWCSLRHHGRGRHSAIGQHGRRVLNDGGRWHLRYTVAGWSQRCLSWGPEFWYQLTPVVPNKRPLSVGCLGYTDSCVVCVCLYFYLRLETMWFIITDMHYKTGNSWYIIWSNNSTYNTLIMCFSCCGWNICILMVSVITVN